MCIRDRAGDAPQATATVAAADADKYQIVYECWQQFENNNPVAAWYSDNGSHGSLPTITEFESGKKYMYFLMLKPKDGYSFSNDVAMTVNGKSVKSSLSGTFLYAPAVKTMTPSIVETNIKEIRLDGAALSLSLIHSSGTHRPECPLRAPLRHLGSWQLRVEFF